MCAPDSRFYVAVNPKYGKGGALSEVWFINQQMGKNKLGSIAKTMSEDAGFTARHVNHSGRKTCVTKLLDAGCFPTEVAQITGHKNLMSLNHYHTVNIDKQKQMSGMLHHKQSTSRVVQHKTVTFYECNENEFDEETNEELLAASQEIEHALSQISRYEEIPTSEQNKTTVLDLPIRQSQGGSLHLQEFLKSKQQPFFQGCTFNAPLNIVIKQ